MQNEKTVKEDNFPILFNQNGFAVVSSVVTDAEVSQLTSVIERMRQKDNDSCVAGVRHLLKRSVTIRKFARSEAMLKIAAEIVGKGARPVKAILFDKTPNANWYVTWHQDLTIAVKEKIEVAGFAPWSVKEGIPHVQPPREVLESIVSLRIHLDDCPPGNGAIKFIPKSHRLGILNQPEIANWRDTAAHEICPAHKGDVIVMSPLILHSSSQSSTANHRRVLHIEYVGKELPHGLQWAESSGLDTVELVMAIEEEFGLEIANEDAEKMTTVGEIYEHLRTRLKTSGTQECLSQKIFYKLRRALIENFQLRRKVITPDTVVSDLLTPEQLEQGWPYLQLFIDLQTPDFKTANHILFFKLSERVLTIRELVFAMISLNRDKIDFSMNSDSDVWNRLVNVIVDQLNVNRDEVVYGASISKDLGAC